MQGGKTKVRGAAIKVIPISKVEEHNLDRFLTNEL